MKYRIEPWKLILPIVWSLFCLGGNVYGAECLDASPTIQAGKDPYTPVSVRDLTPTEQEAVKGLLTSLEGEWQGNAGDIYCRSIKDPKDQEVNRYTAKAKVEVDYYGNFFIRVNLYSQQKRTSHQEVLRLYLTQKKLRVNSSSGYGDVELITASSTTIEFLYRLLLAIDKGKGSNRKEFFVALDWNGRNLTIRQQIYSQGRLSYEQHWQLSQR